MGIFGSKKKTFVSSVVYNMAGDEFRRPNFLKTTIVSSVVNRVPSIANSMSGSYLGGPAMRFRRFKRWAAEFSDYNDLIGLVTGTIKTGNSIDIEEVGNEVPASIGSIVSIQSVVIDDADFTYWADQYVVENFPLLVGTEYVADFDEEINLITITWEDTTTSSFTPTDYDKLAQYMYAVYAEFSGEEDQPLAPGTPVILAPMDDFPDTTGWDLVSSDSSGGELHEVWERTTYMGDIPGEDGVYSLKETMYQDTVGSDRSYQIDTQEIWHSVISPMKVYIYKYGSSNAVLDAMFLPGESMDDFYPVIPFRLKNEFLSDSYLPEIYEEAKRGYKKATTGRYDKLIASLEDNPDIEDIDYAYVVFGVCLNVLENSSRKYIYQFFKEILNDYTMIGTPEYDAWLAESETAKESWDEWVVWRDAQGDDLDPLFGTPAPERLAYPAAPANSLKVFTGANPTINYDITISWNSISESTGSGLLMPDAKPDQLWFTKGGEDTFEEDIYVGGVTIPGKKTNTETIYLNWQIDENSWRRLTITGLKHKNLIYGGKAVEISAFEALDDADESGFIIPLHDGVFRSLGLVDGTQMTTACSFMVFNCYQVVKQKWYQTGIFKIILVVIVIVISYFTFGAGAGLGSTTGVLGTNAAVGTAILGAGASAAAVAIAGAVANALAAMLITKIISAGATALFGEKWGAIIGAIASLIALQVGTAMAGGKTMAESFSGLMRADNILKLTDAAGRGYSGYVQAANADMAAETQAVVENYESEARKIRQMWQDNLGGGNGIIDPSAVTSSFGVTMEDMDSFLQRTLLTGSDIAEMSMDMLTDFVAMTLNNELPT